MKNRSHARGFTLTEIAIVLGIGGFIISAVWVGVSAVNQRQSVKRAVDTLQTIVQNMVSIYQNRPLPAACVPGAPLPAGQQITANMVRAGLVPPTAVRPADGLGCERAAHPWDERPGMLIIWDITDVAIPANPVPRFRISFYNIPLDACIALLLQGTNCDPSQLGCPFAVFTGAGLNPAPATIPDAGPPPNWQTAITPTIAANNTLCGFNSPAGNSVEFDYLLR